MPLKLTISQQPNGVLFSGSGTLNTTSLHNLPSYGLNMGTGLFFRGPNYITGGAIGNTKLVVNLLQNLAPISTAQTTSRSLKSWAGPTGQPRSGIQA